MLLDKAGESYESAARELEREILLLVNERLYAKGGVTDELYRRAKDLILKS